MNDDDTQVGPAATSAVVEGITGCRTKHEVQRKLLELIQSDDADLVAAAAEAAAREGERPLAALACLRAIATSGGDAAAVRVCRASLTLSVAMSLQTLLDAMGWSRATADAWLRDAVSEFDDAARGRMTQALEQARKAVDGGEIDLSQDKARRDRAKSAISRLLAVVKHAHTSNLRDGAKPQSWIVLAVLCVVFAASGLLVWQGRDVLPTPGAGLASKTFWLVAIYIWMPALVASWCLAFFNAKRTRVFDYVSPRHFRLNGGLVAGQHESFRVDLFYHIFQFVWLPALLYLFLIELDYAPLLALAQRYGGSGPAVAETLGWIHRPAGEALGSALQGNISHALVNEQLGWALGLLVGGYSLFMQFRVQITRRRSGVDFYWWDLRVGWPTWVTRWVMVGFDMLFGALMLQKIVIFNAAIIALVANSEAPVSMFAADGFAGLGALRDAVGINAFGTFVLGVFVISSWYLHRDLPQYRASDTGLTLLYVTIILVMIAGPVWRIEHLLSQEVLVERERLIAQALAAAGGRVTPENLQMTSTIRNWNVSLLELNLFSSPLFALIGQVGLLASQTVRRQQKRYSAAEAGA